MKKILTISALVFAAGLPAVAFAESFNASLPAVFNTDAIVSLFALSLMGLLVLGDYARPSRALKSNEPTPTNDKNRHETHRLAA